MTPARSATLTLMQARHIELGDFSSRKEMHEVADVVVNHAVFEAMGRSVGYLDEDMLWLSHPDPQWVSAVSDEALQRFEEALTAVAKSGVDLDELDGRMRGLSWNGRELLLASARVPPTAD